MKISYYKLTEHIEGADLQPVYVVSGDQELLRELAVGRLREAALGEQENGFNSERFDGEEADPQDVIAAANLLPMMGGVRLVVLKRAQRYVEEARVTKDGPKKGSALASFLDYLEDPSPKTVFVLELTKKPDARRKLWKSIEKKVAVIQCDPPKDWELDDWIAERAAERDLRLGRDGIRYLVGEFGSDLRRLLNELEKLSLYAKGEKLDLETMAAVLGRGKAQSIFTFIDSVAAGKSGAALRHLGKLMDEGEPPLKVMALLDRLVGQLRVAKDLAGPGGRRRGPGLAQALGVPPFVAKSLAEHARGFDRAGLDRAVTALAETDRILKSSAVPAKLVLESFVLSLCGASGKRGPRAGR